MLYCEKNTGKKLYPTKDMYKALIDMANMVSPDYDCGKVTRDEVIDFLWAKYYEEKRLEKETQAKEEKKEEKKPVKSKQLETTKK